MRRLRGAAAPRHGQVEKQQIDPTALSLPDLQSIFAIDREHNFAADVAQHAFDRRAHSFVIVATQQIIAVATFEQIITCAAKKRIVTALTKQQFSESRDGREAFVTVRTSQVK